ncbi:hypothetical protein U9M48_023714 [Paspalum notatum var. saurae]|uniref:Transposase-associated domain-containing protein n=1 Tax=Paspalum notatum var. saurae TaxID=547442 RepID=A0AAQ3TMC2_PASNO
MGDRMATLAKDIKARACQRVKFVLAQAMVTLKKAQPELPPKIQPTLSRGRAGFLPTQHTYPLTPAASLPRHPPPPPRPAAALPTPLPAASPRCRPALAAPPRPGTASARRRPVLAAHRPTRPALRAGVPRRPRHPAPVAVPPRAPAAAYRAPRLAPALVASPAGPRWCPCNKHNNGESLLNKHEMAKDLVDYGFMLDYETWTFHSEKDTRVEPEFGLNSKDPPTKEVEEFFKLLKASEEPLHEHAKVSVLAFVTRLIAIKSRYFFSNNCFNDLLQLIGDVLPRPHKLPKDMYHCKRLTKSLGMGYEKLDMCPDSCMIFWGDHKDEKKCLSCGKGRYVEVVNEDGEKVTTDVAHK